MEAAVTDQQRRLVRRSTAGRIAGVCAGIAEYLDTDVTLVRLAWVVLSIVPGGFVGGLVAYVAAWIVMPDAPGPVTTTSTSGRRLTRSIVDRKIGGVCGGLAAYLDVDSTAIRVVWVVLSIVPGCVVMGVVAYLVAWFIMPEPTRVVTQTVPNVA
jgi:phage shock protein PspC (stress-responsive transcriptional regulator)